MTACQEVRLPRKELISHFPFKDDQSKVLQEGACVMRGKKWLITQRKVLKEILHMKLLKNLFFVGENFPRGGCGQTINP